MLSINSKNVITPCVGQCRLDENDICIGCYRSVSEICSWRNKSKDEQIEIVIRCNKQIEKNL
ncbi:MAG: DUF1289 domain-containing protein [Pseudoalteromonas tetraodonis]|nr:DUF1289 domain-containing protein [Pseudoalteromonas tetraodonis]